MATRHAIFLLSRERLRSLVIFAALLICAVTFAPPPAASAAAPSDAIVLSEFIYESAPFPACHASTIVQTQHGLAVAWFGGTKEGNPDVCIWVSLHRGDKWLPVVKVADGIQANGTRYACWNPVLFQPRNGPLLLFYKIGPTAARWWGMMMSSADEGVVWTSPRRLPAGIFGPIKDKPIQFADGTILCPSSTQIGGWNVHMERTNDLGRTWTETGSLNDARTTPLIQPTILDHGKGNLQILCRSMDGLIYESWSTNNGYNWSPIAATALPNPNSGIDAVQLKDGRSMLIYNNSPKNRYPINIAVSPDGHSWKMALVVEATHGELSYPAIIQTDDGLVHITYTWKRQRIRHVVLDPGKIP